MFFVVVVLETRLSVKKVSFETCLKPSVKNLSFETCLGLSVRKVEALKHV